MTQPPAIITHEKTDPHADRFFRLISTNPVVCQILERMPDLGLADCWLVSGGLTQSVWNALSGRPPTHGIRDYDLLYHDDRDLSWEAEDEAIKRVDAAFADLGAPIELRNQARVHLWYEQKHGAPYAPLTSSCAAIDRFMHTAIMVGVQPDGAGGLRLYAPVGLGDVFGAAVRRGPGAGTGLSRQYAEKAARWKALWPFLTVEPWDVA